MGAALDLLAEVAPSVGVRLLYQDELGAPTLYCRVDEVLPDGRVQGFRLAVWETDNGIAVAEQFRGDQLPRFCPERHINAGGIFCTGLKDRGVPHPSSIETATLWWRHLRGYLVLQQEAAHLGTWRAGCAWSHGDAAEFDVALEDAKRQLSPELVEKTLQCHPKTFFGLTARLQERRKPCICGSGLRLKDCHEEAIARYLSATRERNLRLRDFWAEVREECCGTMKTCPLRDRGVVAER